jgi:alpha-1,2-mannosyltransferase
MGETMASKLNYEPILTAIQALAMVFGVFLLAQSLSQVTFDLNNSMDRVVGGDFFCFWSAGRLTLNGNVLSIFDARALATFQQSLVRSPPDFSVLWFYPPLLLLHISALFGLLPYKLAYGLYLAISVGAFYGLSRRYFPAVKPLHILAFPAFWFNLLMGQNGLLTAAILIAGLVVLTRNQITSGVTLALLSYKPHFCLAVPVFLLMEKRVQAIVAGIAALAALIIVSTLLYGFDVWPAFFRGLIEAQTFNHHSDTVKYASFAHLYGSLRVMGLNHELAMPLNYVFVGIMSFAAIRIWMYEPDRLAKYAVVILMTLLLPPHLTYYDLVVTGAVIVWLWPRKACRPALALLWVSPFMWPFLGGIGVPMFSIACGSLLYQLNRDLPVAAASPRQPLAS